MAMSDGRARLGGLDCRGRDLLRGDGNRRVLADGVPPPVTAQVTMTSVFISACMAASPKLERNHQSNDPAAARLSLGLRILAGMVPDHLWHLLRPWRSAGMAFATLIAHLYRSSAAESPCREPP